MANMTWYVSCRRTITAAVAAALLFACGGTDPNRPDGGTAGDTGHDAGTQDGGPANGLAPDAGLPDAGPPDGGSVNELAPDAGIPDAGPPDAGSPDAGLPPLTPNPYPHPDRVVISELQTLGPTGNPADEFVEFYNPTDRELDLTGYVARFLNADTSITRTLCTFPGSAACTCTGFSGRVPAHGYLLLATDVFAAQPGRPTPDCTWNTNAASGTLSGYGGHLRLSAPDGGTVDLLGWWNGVNASSKPAAPETNPASGLSAAGASVERKAVSSALTADMAPGGTYAPSGNSCDTDDNGADFVLRAVAEPQNLASPREP